MPGKICAVQAADADGGVDAELSWEKYIGMVQAQLILNSPTELPRSCAGASESLQNRTNYPPYFGDQPSVILFDSPTNIWPKKIHATVHMKGGGFRAS